LAVSVDGSSYVELPRDYRQNCRVGEVTICKGDTPIYERGRKTCFSRLFFSEKEAQELCTRLVLKGGFIPIFRRLPLSESWLYVVGERTMVETRCQGTGHLTEAAPTQSAEVLHPTAGCDLYVDRIGLPTNRRFESRTEWVATSLVVPSAPDFLPERKLANVRAHQEHLEDVYKQ
jgi:hypothetical protein